MQLLLFRFSAMGDVALLAPVLRQAVDTYPQLRLTLVTRSQFKPFFDNIPHLEVKGVDLAHYKGPFGLFKLFKELQCQGEYDAILDMHQSLRTRVLGFLWSAIGIPVYTLRKYRLLRKALTRPANKVREPLPHVTERYARVFAEAGFALDTSTLPALEPLRQQKVQSWLHAAGFGTRRGLWVGLAPFARHAPKTWPLAKVKELLTLSRQAGDITFFLMGGGVEEVKQLADLHQEFPANTVLLAGEFNLSEELYFIPQLDAMVCMDSSNMHFAALSGVPVVSVWGATHAFAGFAPVGQTELNRVEISTDELACRPCSIFGDKPCYRGDHACMERISAQMVWERLQAVLRQPSAMSRQMV
jgi:ADP-heptose:LPS heptosyltransferase